MTPDAPRALSDPAEVARRWAMLAEPRMAPLLELVARIRAERGQTPFPDPLDGGAEARFLLLLETPGPSIARTGFVSRDNVNGTAVNLWRFLRAAGIPRQCTLIWNVVPYVIHAPGARNRAPKPAEAAAGIGKLTGDTKTEAEGKMDKAEGKVQNTVGGIKDTLRGDKRD